MNADGSNVVQVTKTPESEDMPDWQQFTFACAPGAIAAPPPLPTLAGPTLAGPTPAAITFLDGVFFKEAAVSSGKRFDFLRFWADGNVALNGAIAADAQSAWNSVRGSLTPGNSNIATGKYTLKGKEVAFTLKVVNDVWTEVAGTIEGDKLTLAAKILFPKTGLENWTYTRADWR